MRKSDFSELLSKYLLVMELWFKAMMYSNLGNENSDAGHIKCSRGPQVPTSALDEGNVSIEQLITSYFACGPLLFGVVHSHIYKT